MASPELVKRIREDYPNLAWLIRDPEIGPLLLEAVDPNKGFSVNTFQAKLYQTRWWRTHSQAQREWAITVHTDPAEARRQQKAMKAQIMAQAGQFGTTLTGRQMKSMVNGLLSQGLAPDDPRVLESLAAYWDWKDRGRGAVGAARSQVQALASGYFYTPATRNTRAGRANLDHAALRIAAGKDTLDAYQARLQMDAAKRFPHMRDQIAAGMSPSEIIAPLREIVAEEMEYANPEQVDVLHNPVWRQLLGIRDPKTHKMRMPTQSDVINLVRSQPTWWKTSNGRQADNGMAQTLLNVFGKRKSSAS